MAKGDKFVFELVDGQEVDETLGLERRAVAEQGEVEKKPSRSQRRRARKRQAENDNRKDVEEGRKTEAEVKEEKVRRRLEEEDRVVEKLERGGHGAFLERKMEEMRRAMERQRDEDVREWGRKFSGLEEVVGQQRNEIERLKQELASCYRRQP